MAPAMPALSHWFGLCWPDIEDMPQFELAAYLAALEDIQHARR